jgi:hypothetical protein
MLDDMRWRYTEEFILHFSPVKNRVMSKPHSKIDAKKGMLKIYRLNQGRPTRGP